MSTKESTKDQERKALEQIAKIIESVGGKDSYIGIAFAGCIEMAQSNIDNDFADSYSDIVANREKKLESAAQKLNDKSAECIALKKRAEEAERLYNVTQKTSDSWCAKYNEAKECATKNWNQFRVMEDKAEALELEIIKLKAKLYDMMTAQQEGKS